MRKRKVVYPPPKTATKGGATPARPNAPSTAVTINLDAMAGRADIRQGARVRIAGGLYEGELGVVESGVGGVSPAAVVRTAAGLTRRIRTVDLVPVSAEGPSSEPQPPGPTRPDAAAR